MSNRLPIGAGSRGGHWHEAAYRAAYFRRWRAEHPRYRDLDNQRRLLAHAVERARRVVAGGPYARPRR